MNSISVWVAHLHHPLVLAGFGIFLFALIIKPIFLNNSRLTGTATERLLHRAMLLLFLLAAMAVAGGIALNWQNGYTDQEIAEQHSGSASSGQKQAAEKLDSKTQERQAAPVQVKQETQGEKSPAINAQGNVEVNYAE